MPKSKHSPEFRAKVSQEYLDGMGSVQCKRKIIRRIVLP